MLRALTAQQADAAFRYITRIAFVSMSLIALVLFVFADQAVIIFSLDPSLEPYRDMYAYGLRVYMLCIPFMAVMDMGGALLQALRRARIPMYTAFIRNIIRITLIVLSTTMEEVFWSVFVIEVIGGSLNLILSRWSFRRYRRFVSSPPAQGTAF